MTKIVVESDIVELVLTTQLWQCYGTQIMSSSLLGVQTSFKRCWLSVTGVVAEIKLLCRPKAAPQTSEDFRCRLDHLPVLSEYRYLGLITNSKRLGGMLP